MNAAVKVTVNGVGIVVKVVVRVVGDGGRGH